MLTLCKVGHGAERLQKFLYARELVADSSISCSSDCTESSRVHRTLPFGRRFSIVFEHPFGRHEVAIIFDEILSLFSANRPETVDCV